MIGRLTWSARTGNLVLPVSNDAGNVNIDDQNVPAIVASIVVPRDDAFLALIDPRQTPVPRVQLTGHLTEWQSGTLAELSAYATSQGGTLADLSAAWSGLQIRDVSNMFGAPLYSGASETPETMTLDLHVRDVVYDDWEMTISLASDEALLTDWGLTTFSDEEALAGLQAGMNTQQIQAWVKPWLQYITGIPLVPSVYDTDTFSEPIVDIFDGYVGKSGWDTLRPMLEDVDLKLRVQPNGRQFQLARPENSINNPATHSWLFTAAEVESVRHTLSRTGDWYDSAILYRPASEGVSPGFPDATHSRTFMDDWGGRKPNVSMAENIVRRTQNRGQFIDIVAPIQLGVFMRDEFAYAPTLDDPVEQWIVKSVSYDIGAGRMNIRGEQRY